MARVKRMSSNCRLTISRRSETIGWPQEPSANERSISLFAQPKRMHCGNENSAQHRTLAIKVRRKFRQNARSRMLEHFEQPLMIPLAQLLWLLCCLSLAHNSMADCPSLCECKWKSGKESVLCLNANLTHIPAPLDAGTQVLDLTGNEIASIPHDTFAALNLLNLQKVYLAKCRLRVIERFAFRKLINLVELDLSYNQLTSIPSQALEFVPELREIKLNGNPIQRIADESFQRVPQLVRLELSDCKVSTVEVRAFAGLESSLEWLKLDGNRLSEIRSGTITSLGNLHGIELARNHWNCSCGLRPLRAWMLRENIPCGIPPLCRAPPRLAGKSWDKIELDDFACVPQIIATDTTAHGVEGRNITMSCYVEGVPEPSVRWMVKNRVIANLTATGEPSSSPRTAAATQGRKTYVVNMLRNASNLTILTADMQDAGIYTCAAENKAGKVEASVTLAVSRRPPEAPLGAKIVLLCVLIALLFVVGSSFAAICFCTLRRKRKTRLWNSVPPARTESYEKIEMTARGASLPRARNDKPDFGGNGGPLNERGTADGMPGAGAMGRIRRGAEKENGYLRTAMTPFHDANASSDDVGVAVLSPGGANGKRNGDYRNIPTHCDDDGTGYEDTDSAGRKFSFAGSAASGPAMTGTGIGTGTGTSRWRGGALRTSPQDMHQKASGTSGCPTTVATTVTPTAMTSDGACGGGSGGGGGSATKQQLLQEETDLHIPRLIDIGGSNTDSASSSISGQVDAATRLGGYTHLPTWTTTPIATTKIHSPHSKRINGSASSASSSYYQDEISTSVFCSQDNAERDVFDCNYPDLLDIAKYAVAQATKSNAYAKQTGSGANSMSDSISTGGLCTLPRKLKNTGKYFKSSSDSQSPLLAENSSKYGSSTLGDASFLNDLALGRRFSAESTYSNYPPSATYTTGQRANSFLNLVQSSNKLAGIVQGAASTGGSAAGKLFNGNARRNPSLPSSPVHELHQQQHQRSLSSAATPLLDFSTLATRTGASTTPTSAATAMNNGIDSSLHATPTSTATVTAYDYHAAQLERFLAEYRNLQDQLCKMRETCETIRKKEAPLRVGVGIGGIGGGGVGVGQSAQLADPLMFNAAIAANSPTTNPKATMLKNKPILPGQPPDPPPYWLHRNAMLKRLTDSQTDIFKS